jgi:4-azaleucine resistance transporter AzlC
MLGYLPVGFAYGVLAVKAGLSTANTGLMSVLVFAGSAQLIGVDMIGAGAPPLSVIATTFIVNLRHLLFSAALAPHLSGWPRRRIARFCYQLTDETFALHATRFHNQQQSTAKTLAINAYTQAAWVAGSIAGAVAGGFVPDVRPLGLDFALPAMFAVLLVGQLMTPAHILAALLGGGLALAVSQTPAASWATLLAAVAAAGIASMTPWTRSGRE